MNEVKKPLAREVRFRDLVTLARIKRDAVERSKAKGHFEAERTSLALSVGDKVLQHLSGTRSWMLDDESAAISVRDARKRHGIRWKLTAVAIAALPIATTVVQWRLGPVLPRLPLSTALGVSAAVAGAALSPLYFMRKRLGIARRMREIRKARANFLDHHSGRTLLIDDFMSTRKGAGLELVSQLSDELDRSDTTLITTTIKPQLAEAYEYFGFETVASVEDPKLLANDIEPRFMVRFPDATAPIETTAQRATNASKPMAIRQHISIDPGIEMGLSPTWARPEQTRNF